MILNKNMTDTGEPGPSNRQVNSDDYMEVEEETFSVERALDKFGKQAYYVECSPDSQYAAIAHQIHL